MTEFARDNNVPVETDYISRTAAINEQKRFCGYLDDDMLNRLEIATRRIFAADVRPVVRGEWVERRTNIGIPNVCYFSSCCGFPSWYGKLNFCPNCGADMRKEDKDNV